MLKALIRSCLSETARSLLWLWENDPDGWRLGEYSIAHPGAGVGVWIANSVYGLHATYGISRAVAEKAHILDGRKVRLKWLDRKMLYRAMKRRPMPRSGGPIPYAISEWATKGDKFAIPVS